jgi:hypothetical protein
MEEPMMYRLTLFLLAACLFCGCSESLKIVPESADSVSTEVAETGSEVPSPEMTSVTADLIQQGLAEAGNVSKCEYRDSLYYLTGTDSLYSGWLRDRAKDKSGVILTRILRVKDGKKDGPVVMWYPNGQKASQCIYMEGRSHGHAITWHQNGRKRQEAVFENGEMIGEESRWDQSGKLIKGNGAVAGSNQDTDPDSSEAASVPAGNDNSSDPPPQKMEELSAADKYAEAIAAIRATGAHAGDISESGDIVPSLAVRFFSDKKTNIDSELGKVAKALEGVSFRYVCVYTEKNIVTDEGLRHLKHIRNLGTFYVTGTKITDASLEHLKECKSLKILRLTGTQVTTAGCKELKKALPKASISLW